MNWKEHKKQLMKNPEFKKEYDLLEPEYKLAAALINLRLEKGFTQEEVAQTLNTKQASIARLESGSTLPSLSMVKRYVQALGADLDISIKTRS